MRCPKCKNKIENENLYRCPHCGKVIKKKEKRDPKELASLISFITVSGVYIMLNFIGLFFSCDYYNIASLAIGIVVFLIAVPFILGSFHNIAPSFGDWTAFAVSIPFFINWFATFVPHCYSLSINSYDTAYYFSVVGVIAIVDSVIILKALGTIKSGKIIKWFCLALGIAEAVFTFVYYLPFATLSLLAIMIIAINNLLPAFVIFYTIMKDSKANLA